MVKLQTQFEAAITIGVGSESPVEPASAKESGADNELCRTADLCPIWQHR